MSIKILFLGDICSKAGRNAVYENSERLARDYEAHFIIANGENAAGGFGIAPNIAIELLQKIDCITLGDHFLDRKELVPFLEDESRIIRPLNYPKGTPGRGYQIFQLPGSEKKIAVINLLGRIFLKPIDCPFQRVQEAIALIREQTRIIIVDFHAEATAEKMAMGWFLDGEVSSVIGTHTHIPTADERILPKGTAYITDVGMCGAHDSVLGMRVESSLKRLMTGIPYRLEPADSNVNICGVLIEIDEDTGKARSIRRIKEGVQCEARRD